MEEKMEKALKLPEITMELMNRVENLQQRVEQLSKAMINLGKNNRDFDIIDRVLADLPSNIIPFPLFAGSKAAITPCSKCFSSGWLLAMPGEPLPGGFTDYRPLLQRNGLILLSWDKRKTEMGERYTAYWVTSSGIPRFYASKPHSFENFPYARPDHKSYAAEDGIEFYGQEAPAYVVHVAPELMMHNPQHGELRLAHIQTLKKQGSKLDFNYKYLLKTEKNRDTSHKMINGKDGHRAG